MAYQGIFLRHYLGQTPSSSDTGLIKGWTASPDIIPCPSPADPTIFTLEANYGNPYSSNINVPATNYVYVRGLNATLGATTARLWFYYVNNNVLLWPQNWMFNNVSVSGKTQNYMEVSATTANQIIVGNPPFVWNAPAGDHYCMVVFVENPPLSDPPMPPLPGYMGSFAELAKYVITNPNMAWRNTTDVNVAESTWTKVVPINGAPDGGEFLCGVQMNKMAVGGIYSFSVPGPDADNTIDVPKSAIISPNQNFTIPVTWPAGFTSSMTISYWKGNTSPQVGASIGSVVIYSQAMVDKMIPELALSAGQFRPQGLRQPSPFFAYESTAMQNGGVIPAYIIGSYAYSFR